MTEKLQAKDVTTEPIVVQKAESVPVGVVSSLPFDMKFEDHLSTGSAGSAVVDEDAPQLLDSSDSYFPSDEYPGCVGPVDGVHSEEDDGSDDGRSYFPNVFATNEQQHEESLGWWVWS